MENNKIVSVTGGFDVLHLGHLQILEYAKSLGNKLIVFISSDQLTRKEKGDLRPVNNQIERKQFLEKVKFVDNVIIFTSYNELNNLLKKNKVDLLVTATGEKKSEINDQLLQIIFFPKIIKKSTSSILKTYAKLPPPF